MCLTNEIKAKKEHNISFYCIEEDDCMMHIKSLDEGLEVFKALGSDIRIEIIKLLIKNKGMNMNALASALNITNGALTSHVKKLEDCGIITIVSESAGHGNQKKMYGSPG
jgi:predicted transcriptional regulator